MEVIMYVVGLIRGILIAFLNILLIKSRTMNCLIVFVKKAKLMQKKVIY